MKYYRIFAALVFAVFSVPANGQSDSSQTQVQFLLFSARSPSVKPLSPGHAFVSFGWTTPTTDASAHIKDTYGFYPCEGCNMVNDEKPGRVVKGFWKNRNKKTLQWLAVTADTTRNTKTEAIIEQWHNVRYNLFRRNCVKFISEIAKAQGLCTPRTTRFGIFPKFPTKYIHELMNANPGRLISINGMNKDGLPVELDEDKNNIPDLVELELSGQY